MRFVSTCGQTVSKSPKNPPLWGGSREPRQGERRGCPRSTCPRSVALGRLAGVPVPCTRETVLTCALGISASSHVPTRLQLPYPAVSPLSLGHPGGSSSPGTPLSSQPWMWCPAVANLWMPQTGFHYLSPVPMSFGKSRSAFSPLMDSWIT